jgi:transglutaminase-like putative cysteine protease
LRRFAKAVALLATLLPNATAAPRPKAPLVQAQMVPSPYRISAAALSGTIRYRIRQPKELPIAWPSTGEQRIVAAQNLRPADTVVLEICTTCGDEMPPSTAQLRAALAPSHWVDATDGKIISLARLARVPTLPATRDFRLDKPAKMRQYFQRMLDAVRAHFPDVRDVAEAQTASEAVRSRRADCGEFALVLAAVARTRGIPARVAFGMSYSPRDYGKAHQFVPHVWTQLWSGERWVSVDAALLRFDAGHIAMALGDGQPAAVAGSLRARPALVIEAAGAVPK